MFELLADSGQGGRPKLICRRASLHPKWKLEQSGDAPQHCLFNCHCAESGQEETVQLHQARVAAYARKFLRPATVPLPPSDFPPSVRPQLSNTIRWEGNVMDALQSHRYDYQPVGLAHHQKHLTRRSVLLRASSRSPQRYKFLRLTMSNLGIPRFEESFIQNLAAHQATAMLRRGLDTILVHSTPNASGTQVLNIIGCVGSKGGGLFRATHDILTLLIIEI